MSVPAKQDARTSARLLAFEPPPHWQIKPLRYLFESVGGATPSKDNPAYWDGTIPWVSPKDMKTDVISDSEDHISEAALNGTRLALLPPSTVLVVVRGMILAHTIPVAVTALEATINQDMKGLSPKKGVAPEYLAHLLRAVAPALFSTIEESGHGTRCLRLDLWRNILVGVPPEDEQRAIASFVEERSAYIDSLIAKKQRQIELLDEKRQVLISQAVTKGLDPTAPMKDSGIPWLGDIPAQWDVIPLRYLLRESPKNGISPPPASGVEGVPSFSIAAVRGGKVDVEPYLKFVDVSLKESEPYRIECGDILVMRGNANLDLVGSCGMVLHGFPAGCTYPDILIRIKPSHRIIPELLVLSLNSNYCRWQVKVEVKTSNGTYKISGEGLAELKIVVPPSTEQIQLTRFIIEQVGNIERLIGRISDQIAKLQEYRRTLITAAVTGKIDVGEEKAVQHETATAKPVTKANPYFRRTVFAAAIIDRLCGEPTFGHVKFQKCMYVAQHHLHVDDFEENYRRAAAGPYDNRLVRSIDSQLEKQRWFRAEKIGDRYAYRRLEKAGGHQKYFDGYFGGGAEQLDWLLNLFRPMNTDQAEIVATLYAVWNDFLIRGEEFDDDRLVEEVLTNWDETKKRFGPDRWRKAVRWMREKGLVPSGFGKPTDAAPGGK